MDIIPLPPPFLTRNAACQATPYVCGMSVAAALASRAAVRTHVSYRPASLRLRQLTQVHFEIRVFKMPLNLYKFALGFPILYAFTCSGDELQCSRVISDRCEARVHMCAACVRVHCTCCRAPP